MALDLSALEEKPAAAAAPAGAAQPTGKPLDIPLADIEEDPDQPRKEFTPEAMQEMTDSIRARGVKTPVSVRTHPTKPGKWMLNYGARRYRGSVAAGRASIPAFVDESHDDYDQVIENIQRDDLKPMELAFFIKKRLDAGDQKKAIAKNLGKDGAIITQHLALIDPPACIEDAYSNGKCVSPKTLYELRGLHEKFPEQVEAWCADATEITRKMVAELADELKGKKKPAPEAGEAQQGGEQTGGDGAGKFGHDQIPGGGGEGSSEGGNTGNEGEGGKSKPAGKKPEGGESDEKPGAGDDDGEGEAGRDTGELTSWPKGRAVSDPDRMSKPLMLVEFDGRSAAVLLNRRPSTPGLIHIRFEDGGGDQEVDAGACKINLLTEADK
ncbi:MAG: ParB/RepB/Spo0J family partition protein [Gallionella sp.]|nr:ParB/RepB/Spo0J family partition protein [Gallionella sp.]